MFSHILSPAVRRFKPDLILVSAGYDAHWRDPLEKQQFQSRTYHFLTGGLRMLADDLCGEGGPPSSSSLVSSPPAFHRRNWPGTGVHFLGFTASFLHPAQQPAL